MEEKPGYLKPMMDLHKWPFRVNPSLSMVRAKAWEVKIKTTVKLSC